MLLNLVPSDYTIQITMVYIKLDGCNQSQIVYIDMELERESLCLVNELAFFNEYICSFDNQVRNQIVHAISIKTFCCCCAFLCHPPPTMTGDEYTHYKILLADQ